MEALDKSNKRDSLVFYRSYFEAIETLSKRNKLSAYEAIIKYALNQEIANNLPSRVLAILKMAMPNIDANNKKYNAKRKKQEQKFSSDFENEIGEKVPMPKKEDMSIQSNNVTDVNLNESDIESILNEF